MCLKDSPAYNRSVRDSIFSQPGGIYSASGLLNCSYLLKCLDIAEGKVSIVGQYDLKSLANGVCTLPNELS